MDLVAIITEAEDLRARVEALKERVGQAYDAAPNKSRLKNALSTAHGTADSLAKAAQGVGDAVRGALGEALIKQAQEAVPDAGLEVVAEALAAPRLKLVAKELAATRREEASAEDAVVIRGGTFDAPGDAADAEPQA